MDGLIYEILALLSGLLYLIENNVVKIVVKIKSTYSRVIMIAYVTPLPCRYNHSIFVITTISNDLTFYFFKACFLNQDLIGYSLLIRSYLVNIGI